MLPRLQFGKRSLLWTVLVGGGITGTPRIPSRYLISAESWLSAFSKIRPCCHCRTASFRPVTARCPHKLTGPRHLDIWIPHKVDRRMVGRLSVSDAARQGIDQSIRIFGEKCAVNPKPHSFCLRAEVLVSMQSQISTTASTSKAKATSERHVQASISCRPNVTALGEWDQHYTKGSPTVAFITRINTQQQDSLARIFPGKIMSSRLFQPPYYPYVGRRATCVDGNESISIDCDGEKPCRKAAVCPQSV